MRVEEDFVDFIKLLNDHEVKYLIVGAYALALYTEPRNTGDIDIYVENTSGNVKKVLQVLEDFGFSELDITKEDIENDDTVIQLGYPPVRIDIITEISGVIFNDAYNEKVVHKFGEIEANFISKRYLIENKKASSRKKDQSDLEMLLKK